MVSILIDKNPEILERNMLAGILCYTLTGLGIVAIYLLYVLLERLYQ